MIDNITREWSIEEGQRAFIQFLINNPIIAETYLNNIKTTRILNKNV